RHRYHLHAVKNGFSSTDGTPSNPGVLFKPTGVDWRAHAWGEVRFGRQYSASLYPVQRGDFDAFGAGTIASRAEQTVEDHAVRQQRDRVNFSPVVGGFSATVMTGHARSFGERRQTASTDTM
ncbi:porin, partial [Paraburkholderia dipogonis]|uniref:porin n=1 Tax=Paraburkholderia dipogonis TaxID=1211383 RepID=UPI0035E5CF7C